MSGDKILKIAKNKVVTIDYLLRDQDGNILDSSEENGQLSYIQGLGHIIPGLEKALDGKSIGEKINVVISPEDGYGARDENLVMTVNRDEFETDAKLKVGLQIEADTEEGPAVFTIIDIHGDNIKIDGNHPLAGESLHFEVMVQGVREASSEEISHGHVH